MKENEKSAGTPAAILQNPKDPGDEALKLLSSTRLHAKLATRSTSHRDSAFKKEFISFHILSLSANRTVVT